MLLSNSGESRAPIATKTIDLFIYNYGVEAGNLALKMMALGGLYLGGGISSKLGKAISGNAGFLKGFFSKGRLESLLRQIPVFVVLNEDTALLGAGLHALAGVE